MSDKRSRKDRPWRQGDLGPIQAPKSCGCHPDPYTEFEYDHELVVEPERVHVTDRGVGLVGKLRRSR